MDDQNRHESVLLEEAVNLLGCKPGGIYVDGTLGGGGHAEKILEKSSPNGVLVGIDTDPHALKIASERLRKFSARVHLVQGNFSDLQKILRELGFQEVHGILLDLGVSMFQLGEAQRGFSFRMDGPLDMRMDPTIDVSATDLVNKLPEHELRRLIKQYGEEKWAGKIAKEIVRVRKETPITTTGQLAKIIERVVPKPRHGERIHPATRTFQALRIVVNKELESLRRFLDSVLDILAAGGRLVIISFHSLEDRIVKQAFNLWSRSCRCPRDVPVCRCEGEPLVRILTKKPVRPTEDETLRNPRARSAKMRAIEKLQLTSIAGLNVARDTEQ